VTTILGSCVAVCLYDRVTGHGGVNHFVLPERMGEEGSDARFGEHAIDLLIERMVLNGSAQKDLLAKVFGGSQTAFPGASRSNVGAANVALANELLEKHGIRVLASDTGGARGRKLIFHTDLGEAWLKRL
jgi:chemotaxis protein CheD